METQNRNKNSNIRKNDISQHLFFNNNFKYQWPQLYKQKKKNRLVVWIKEQNQNTS